MKKAKIIILYDEEVYTILDIFALLEEYGITPIKGKELKNISKEEQELFEYSIIDNNTDVEKLEKVSLIE